jgi:hypothetical protein
LTTLKTLITSSISKSSSHSTSHSSTHSTTSSAAPQATCSKTSEILSNAGFETPNKAAGLIGWVETKSNVAPPVVVNDVDNAKQGYQYLYVNPQLTLSVVLSPFLPLISYTNHNVHSGKKKSSTNPSPPLPKPSLSAARQPTPLAPGEGSHSPKISATTRTKLRYATCNSAPI